MLSDSLSWNWWNISKDSREVYFCHDDNENDIHLELLPIMPTYWKAQYQVFCPERGMWNLFVGEAVYRKSMIFRKGIR